MSAPIFSEWFPLSQKPLLPGWYDVGIGFGTGKPQRYTAWPRYWDGKEWNMAVLSPISHVWWRGLRKWVLARPNDPINQGNGYVVHITRRTVQIAGRIECAKTFDSALEALQYRDRNDCCRQEQDFQAVLV